MVTKRFSKGDGMDTKGDYVSRVFSALEKRGKAETAEYMRKRGPHGGQKDNTMDLRKETQASPASGGQVYQSGAKNVTQGGRE
jgi:hypothetical protein